MTTEAGTRTVLYFGKLWDSPRFDFPRSVTPVQRGTPVGEACTECREAIAAGDRGEWVPRFASLAEPPVFAPVHFECQMLGLIGHSFGVCGCTSYAGAETRRAAALVLLGRVNAGRAEQGHGPI